ncbi:type VI secretion system-associated protein TagF [Rhodanobacter umsongensis]|uniref:Type VI secretion system-associated protein TagF n=1 Tax=Rhodanobacter umsongensis TaxID=633153 RepID=A0ABW0JPP3_9GAMM
MPNPAAGFFGKLPSAGDFVQRRLPPGFVDAWDRHFENAVAESRNALNAAWHEAYHASPAWRFMLSPAVCGESAWAGVMGPGVDRVGRCFPMVIAAPIAADAGFCARALVAGDSWFELAEQVHFAAQADASVSVDVFDEQVAALAGPLEARQPDPLQFLQGIDWNAASHWRLPLPVCTGTGAFLGDLWSRLATTPGSWCLWWTTGTERVPASVLITNGLPQPAAYAGFLDAGYSSSPWQSMGMFDNVAQHPGTVADFAARSIDVAPATPPPATPVAWLPDDLELFSDLGAVPASAVSPVPLSHAGIDTAAPAPGGAGAAALSRTDCALTLLAAEVGAPDPRQRAAAAVFAIGRDLAPGDLTAGMQTLRTRIMALNPPLRQSSEDLIDPVLEDCAVIAVHVADGQADLLRIGTAAAWHWRRGRLQPFFARSTPSPIGDAGADDDFNDLLFSRVSLTAPGLGATMQPTCSEVFCAVEAGDRLLLMATQQLLQLPPEVLACSLAMPSCDDARLHLATAAGLGADATRWPLAIIEIDA